MENNCKEESQNMDNEPLQFSSDCLAVSVVLRKIFENFSNAELLELSLVNKLWNYEARTVMRDRGTLTAKAKSGLACQDIIAFASDVRQMNIVPFSGIKAQLKLRDYHYDRDHPSSTKDLDQNLDVILSLLKWKHLSLSFNGSHWKQHKECPTFLLAKKTLEGYFNILEKLSLDIGEYRAQAHVFHEIVQDCNFPRLKILKINGDLGSNHEATKKCVKNLLSRSPDLQELQHEGFLNFGENIVEGSPALLVTNCVLNPAFQDVCESLVGSLSIKNMGMETFNRDFYMKKFNRVTPILLQNSRTTLNSLDIELMFVVPLMCYGVRLENVKDLRISVNYNSLDNFPPRFLGLVKAFDFTRILPQLKAVHVSGHIFSETFPVDQVRDFMEQANFLSLELRPDRAVNIKHLKSSLGGICTSVQHALDIFAEWFPDIGKLTLRQPAGSEIPYGAIWKHWMHLEELEIGYQYKHYDCTSSSPRPKLVEAENLDHIFCGIFPEEVAELRKKDHQYLRAVNVVPVMPSMTCLRALRSFRLVLNGYRKPRCRDSTFVLSRVTGMLAFKKSPGLLVDFRTNSCGLDEDLSHLKPYASVRFERRWY